MDFKSLVKQKADIEQQLSELTDLFDGLDNPAVADKVAKLEVQKAELAGRLDKLLAEIENSKAEISNISEKISKCSRGVTQQLLNAIIGQPQYFIKNKEKIFFDAMTGVILPNPHYFDDIPKYYDADMTTSDFDKEIKKYKDFDLHGYKLNYPNTDNFKYYHSTLRSYAKKYFKNSIQLIISDLSKSRNNDYIENIFRDGVFCGDYAVDSGQCLAFPLSDKLVSDDLLPDNNVFTRQERAEKVLNLFIQEGWIPKFDDDENTKLYEKMYVTRPALIKQLAEINQKLAELPPPQTGFADGIDFTELIKGYDLTSIRSSLVRYHAELVRWFSELLTSLDDFSREQAPLLAEAQTLIDSLRDTIDEDDGQDAGEKILTERAQYLSQHLDFGLESLQAELVAFKNEAMISRDTLTSARTLTDLRQIEKQERPDFYLVAEHSAELIKLRLQGVDWFREHKDLATILIELHQEWRSDLHTFEHTTCTHFMEKCAGESIDSEKGEAWFAEWRRERLLAEEHLLPMMRSGIERIVPVEIVVETVKLLKSSIRDQLGRFFYDELIPLHIELSLKSASELQIRFEKEIKLTAINSEFQKQLEELIFKIDGTEGRLFLVRWAKDWYDSLVGDVLAFIDKDEFHERIARETLDGFRAMKRHTLEAFLQDVKAYAVAREEKDKEWNSLLFRMRSELAKKADKFKKSTK